LRYSRVIPWNRITVPGPFEAVQDVFASDDRFEVDHARERMLFTFNPSGFLRRR
jgi:cephalosporin hydroxylase